MISRTLERLLLRLTAIVLLAIGLLLVGGAVYGAATSGDAQGEPLVLIIGGLFIALAVRGWKEASGG